ncbi:MAG: outer membrane lipoprotein carrier protein LolA [Jatrophihabitantaceae bacterium]
MPDTHPDEVRTASIFQHHRAIRWSVPMCVAGVVGLAAGGVFTAGASPESLPTLTPAALLADVQSARVPGFSGTIVAQMSLGLPELPAQAGGAGPASVARLLSGSHTMRFWYDGPDRQRLAMLGTTNETDIFHNGRDVWQWDSDAHVATHSVLPAGPEASTRSPELTPQELAERAIAAIDPSTRVSIAANRRVADRSAYELVLTPRDSATRVGSVHIAVDGSTKMPLGVQVFPRGSESAAIDVSFSEVTFKKPSADNFRFIPPPGATVHEGSPSAAPDPPTTRAPEPADTAATTIGSGWTTIAEFRWTPARIDKAAGPLLKELKAAHGPWGSGRLLTSALVSVLITDDGRVFAGAVDPSALFAAATAHR